MGKYLNPPSNNFKHGINSEIYVDKTGLISFTNKKINTLQKYICISRPRRFGKSMAADMLCSYYSSAEDTSSLFNGLAITEDNSYGEHLNKYLVIKLDMQYFMTKTKSVNEMLEFATKSIIEEFADEFPKLKLESDMDLSQVCNDVFEHSGKTFVMLLDEWDCVMRRYHSQAEQKIYLDFLRNWIKDQPYIALAYITGILPIKKYGEHSALNMFSEYSMIRSYQVAQYFGFTENEAKELCDRYNMSFGDAKEWYDGYCFISGTGDRRQEYSIYSPKSVIDAMLNAEYDSYWTQTETYEALKGHIQMNFDGLKDAVVQMLAGNSVSVNTRSFQNDMSTLNSKDDVLTLLVHLGYLCYNSSNSTVSIPNKEVAQEFIASIQNIPQFFDIVCAVNESRLLLEALWNADEKTVAQGIEKAHQHFSSINYNNENALSCVIELAFYFAREYYTVVRELSAGKGFADICFIPKPGHSDKPAVIIELKWDKSADTAIQQIKQKDYPDVLKSYQGNMILCGISYSKDNAKENKQHHCKIEMLTK